MPPSTRWQYFRAAGTRSTRRRSKANARARAPSGQKGLLACLLGSSSRDTSDCTTLPCSRDCPANTSKVKNQDQDRDSKTDNGVKQLSRSETHPAGGQKT